MDHTAKVEDKLIFDNFRLCVLFDFFLLLKIFNKTKTAPEHQAPYQSACRVDEVMRGAALLDNVKKVCT